jgi:hypothetical protein
VEVVVHCKEVDSYASDANSSLKFARKCASEVSK